MLKHAYDTGVNQAFAKFALSETTRQNAMSTALARRGLQANPEMPVNAASLHAARTGRPLGQASGVLTPNAMVESGLGTAAPGAMNAVKRFGRGQLAHGQNMLSGFSDMVAGRPGGGSLAWGGLKGALPSIAALGGLGLLMHHGHDDDQQQQRPY